MTARARKHVSEHNLLTEPDGIRLVLANAKELATQVREKATRLEARVAALERTISEMERAEMAQEDLNE